MIAGGYYLDEELKIDFPEIEYAYVDAYGAVRKLDLSGDAPADTGEAIQCEGFLFALPDNIPAYPGTGLYYRCESVDTVQKSWQGRKFHGNDTDGWTLGEDIVVLKYANTIPQPGKIYNAAATLEVEALYLGFSAEELLQTRTITLCSLSDGDSFVKTSNNVNDPDASATDPGETVPYLAALLNGQTPLLVSDKENGATFHSNYFKSDKVSTVRTFEFEGNNYYYGTFDSTLVITDEKQSLPQLNHIEPLDAVRLMLEQFFWLGGSF